MYEANAKKMNPILIMTDILVHLVTGAYTQCDLSKR